MKRIIAIALVIVMIVALVGCGNKKRQPIQLTLSTEDAEAILNAAGIRLPDISEAAGANSVVKWYAWYDPLQNYDEGEIINSGYWTFQNKYNSTIDYVETTYEARNDDLANLLMGGTPPDCAPVGTSNTAVFPMSCLKGMYQPVDQWIDYTDPLWADMADAAEYFALGGHHFAIVTDLAFKSVMPYNRRVMDEWGFDDPAELYWNDEWTWDVYKEMCFDFTDGDANRYAVDGWYVVNSLVEESTGHYIVQKNEDGKFYSNLDDPVIERAEDFIYDLVKNECTYREGNSYWANRNDAQYGAGIKDGLCLFWPCDDSGFTHPVDEINAVWGDIEAGELMFAPLPRDPDGDGIYYLNSTPTGYMVITGAKNPEGVYLLAACTRFKIIDPTVVNIDRKQLKETYKWTEEMLEMWDECRRLASENIRMYYTGDMPDNLQSTYNSIDWGIHRSGASNTFAQLREQYGERLQYYLDEINAMVKDYTYTGSYNG